MRMTSSINGVVPAAGGGHRLQQRGAADLGHVAADKAGALDRDGRGVEQALVQDGGLFRLRVLASGTVRMASRTSSLLNGSRMAVVTTLNTVWMTAMLKRWPACGRTGTGTPR